MIAVLKARRQRLTRPRIAVVEGHCAAGRPVTVRELHGSLAGVDLVTVYRSLAWLIKLGVAREVTVHGAERFELVDGRAHAHHLHCDRCGRLTTAAVCGVDRAVYARILREHGFEVTDHTLTFRGRCAECRGGS